MSSAESNTRTQYRACNLCEAICGLEFKLDGEKKMVFEKNPAAAAPTPAPQAN